MPPPAPPPTTCLRPRAGDVSYRMEAFALTASTPPWDEMAFHPFFQETLVARPSSGGPKAVIMAAVPPVPPAPPPASPATSTVSSPRAIVKLPRRKVVGRALPRASLCHHGRARRNCVPCGGENTCPHRRLRDPCNACRLQGTGGRMVCEHGRYHTLCSDCGGSSYYQNKCRRIAAAAARDIEEA